MKPLPITDCVPRELLAPLRGKLILITGSTGFVGRWMAETLLHADPNAMVARTSGDGDLEQFARMYPDVRFDYVVHCAKDGLGLEQAMSLLKPGGKMLYLSSGAVYGKIKEPVIEDRHQPSSGIGHWMAGCGHSSYGLDKVQHERKCRNVAVIARLFSFIGPGLRRHTGKEFLEADPIHVKNPLAVRSYLSAWDMVNWLWTILLNGQVGRAYNVGSKEAMHVNAFGVKCASIRSCYITSDRSPSNFTDYYVPDTTRAETELGVRQTVSLADAIRRTLEWMK